MADDPKFNVRIIGDASSLAPRVHPALLIDTRAAALKYT
jgi:hypothetical protein